jgi:hypothetical protein
MLQGSALRLMLRQSARPWSSKFELLVLVVDDRGVRPWEEEVLMARVPPSDDVGRLSARVA